MNNVRADKTDDQIKLVQAHFKFKDGKSAVKPTKLKAVLLGRYPADTDFPLLQQGLSARAAELLKAQYNSGKYLEGTTKVTEDMRLAGGFPTSTTASGLLNTFGGAALHPGYLSLRTAYGQLSFAYSASARVDTSAAFMKKAAKWKGKASMNSLIKQYKA
ncbi:MAG: hypothetical protein EOP09_20350, partial [Proteobacteria bacterium]